MPKIRLTENLNLLLASVALAFLAWVFVKAGEAQESRLNVPVTLTNVDPRLDVEVVPPSMPVYVRYSKDAAPYISSDNFQFQIDASSLRDGLGVDWKSRSIPLGEKEWVANVPARVELIKVGTDSSTVEIRMRWRAQLAVVEPDLAGVERIPEGYQLVTPVKVTPSQVYIVGSDDRIAALPKDEITSRPRLLTERVNVAERKQSALETVPILLPPGIEIIQRQSRNAEVSLEIREVQTVREIRGVPLNFQPVSSDSMSMEYDTRTASVSVYGPQSLLRQLTPESFRMVLIRPREELPGTTRELPIEAHFAAAVSEEVRTRVSIRGVEPRSLQVRYVEKQTTGTLVSPEIR